jgi:hypothetical protein
MAKLTEQEQQEIIRFLEGGKPLPDKYRFLLFEDKREVELVWNGKTGEVCNVVLPFQVIEQVDEPRAEKGHWLQSGLFDMDLWPPAQRLDQQADLGRQQADSVQPEKWPADGKKSKNRAASS